MKRLIITLVFSIFLCGCGIIVDDARMIVISAEYSKLNQYRYYYKIKNSKGDSWALYSNFYMKVGDKVSITPGETNEIK